MTTFLMTMERLHTLLDAYGASPSRWPAAEREAAEAMIAASDGARAAFAEAAHLDAMLDQAPPPPAADRLGWRLRAVGPKAEPVVASGKPRTGWMGNFARAAAVVLAVAGGVAIGIALPDHQSVQIVAGNDSSTTAAATGNALSSAPIYEEAELDDGDLGTTSITLAGYSEDAQSLSLPLQ